MFPKEKVLWSCSCPGTSHLFQILSLCYQVLLVRAASCDSYPGVCDTSGLTQTFLLLLSVSTVALPVTSCREPQTNISASVASVLLALLVHLTLLPTATSLTANQGTGSWGVEQLLVSKPDSQC